MVCFSLLVTTESGGIHFQTGRQGRQYAARNKAKQADLKKLTEPTGILQRQTGLQPGPCNTAKLEEATESA